MWGAILNFVKKASSMMGGADAAGATEAAGMTDDGRSQPIMERGDDWGVQNKAEDVSKTPDNTGSEKPQKIGFWRAFVDKFAESNPVYAGIQAKAFPEDAALKFEMKREALNLSKLRTKQALLNYSRSKFAHDQEIKDAPLNEEKKKLDLENSRLYNQQASESLEHTRASRPLQLARLEASAKREKFLLQKAQEGAWDKDFVNTQDVYINQLKKQAGYGQWNSTGQSIFDNSDSVKAFGQLSYLVKVSSKNPEQFNYMMSKFQREGWEPSRDDKDELTLTHKNLDGKEYRFVANDAGLKKLAGDIQEKMKYDMMAARITGIDSRTPGEAVAKTVISNPVVKNICGDEGNAYRYYSDFYNRKIFDPKTGASRDMFSPEQKTYHQLNLLIGGALEDNKFSEAEKTTLLPQVANMIKYLGGELNLGQTVDDKTVTWGRNSGYAQTYSIKDFLHTVLRDKDVITPAFGDYLQSIASKKRGVGAGSGGIAGGDGGNTQATEHKEKRISEAGSMYGSLFKDADDKKQNHIISVMDKFKSKVVAELKKKNVSTYKELGLDDLRKLDEFWKAEMDDKKFYSPVQNEIFLLERDDLYAQKAPLIKKLIAFEKKDKNTIGRGKNYMSKKTADLRIKIDRINDAIKMREKKLKERGVQFKEYK